MAFLDYNLANMRGIDEKRNQMSSQAFQREGAAKGRFFDNMQNLVGTLNRRSELGKEKDFRAGESEKERQARIKAAGLLAGERGGVRDWERGEGFGQDKELKQMEIDARNALARLEAELRKTGTDGDFNLDVAYAAVMSYTMGIDWGGPGWAPEAWDQAKKDTAMRRLDIALGAYDNENALLVRKMAEEDINGYLLPEEPGVDEGVPIKDPIWENPDFSADAQDYLRYRHGPTDFGNIKDAFGEWAQSLKDTPRSGINAIQGPTKENAAAQTMTSLEATEPTGRTLENPALWDEMLRLLRRVPTQTLDDPSVKSYLKEAADGDIQSTYMESMIQILKRALSPASGGR